MNEVVALPPPIHSDAGNPLREIRVGGAIAGAFFVLFLGWAAFVPLDAGVNAPGQIAVSGNRQTVQHKDGGVVTGINVREGQHVKAGDVVVELSAPELKASERALTSDYLTLLAQRARLMSERLGLHEFAPPPEFATLSQADREIATQVLELQHSEMNARSGDGERRFRASRTLIGAKRRLAVGLVSLLSYSVPSSYGLSPVRSHRGCLWSVWTRSRRPRPGGK